VQVRRVALDHFLEQNAEIYAGAWGSGSGHLGATIAKRLCWEGDR
jgi:hypothetical protein